MADPAAPTRDSELDPVLLFMHIPKTAGTALRTVLGSAYPERERLYLYPPEDLPGAVHPRDFGGLPDAERRRLRFVMGHFTWGAHEAIPGPARYVTLLRDPLDRVISLYYHYKSHMRTQPGSPGLRERELIEEGGLSLEDWVFEARRPAIDNGMVRQIVGHRGIPFGQCPDSLLTEALEHISERFEAVLIRGRMPQSLEILEALVGRKLPRVRSENVNRDRPSVSEIDPTLRKRIRELNHLDDRLFRSMLERFPATHERLVGGAVRQRLERSRPEPLPVEPRPSESARTGPAESPAVGGLAIGDRTLCLMHIAKTGGTTLRETLKKAYRSDESAFVYEPADLRGAVSRDQLVEMSAEERAKLRLVVGHFPFGIHREVGRPCRYLVVIRDPVDRVVSLYYHYLHLSRWRRRGGRAREEQQRMRRSRISLEDWVFGQNRLTVDNGQTRNLAARRRVGFGNCPDDLLDEALGHVEEHFAAMLVTDRLRESVPLLERISGRQLRGLKEANRNRKRLPLDELDPVLLERIRELNHLDARLYETAVARLDGLLTQLP